jgi:hypothetical protein
MKSKSVLQVITLVEGGVGILAAIKSVYTHPCQYYRTASADERKKVCEARNKFKQSQTLDKNTVCFTLTLPVEYSAKLQRVCDERLVSRNQFIRGLLRASLD